MRILQSRMILILTLLVLGAGTALADEAAPAAGVVNINTAAALQLELLPGVGPKVAERIVAWRDQNGPFKKTTDLMQIQGIGEKTFERLSPYLTLEGKTTLASEVRLPRKPRADSPSNKAQRQ
ncbi:MAG TPA: helix-hairpin-helix domain-containing protein [Thermoanaerobaculia bacterium]|nr:helix-hairpin-helix domain-containing protein [Thermoanaerobaculia bacterium]